MTKKFTKHYKGELVSTFETVEDEDGDETFCVTEIEQLNNFLPLINQNISEIRDFVELEKSKGEKLCKKTLKYLYHLFNEDLCESCVEGKCKSCFCSDKNEKFTHYSSGRKRNIFDKFIDFYEHKITANGIVFEKIIFCKQELENYATSHRVYELELDDENWATTTLFLKVFEYKHSKI